MEDPRGRLGIEVVEEPSGHSGPVSSLTVGQREGSILGLLGSAERLVTSKGPKSCS